MLKADKLSTSNNKDTKGNEANWQYEYARKAIEGWPEWKKETYETNFSGTNNRKETINYK